MNITLSDKDLDSLVEKLVPKVVTKVLDQIASAATYEKAKERGNMFAAIHVNAVEFSAADEFERILRADGQKLLKESMAQALKSVIGDEKAIENTAKIAFANHIVAEAEEMIRRYRQEQD